MKAPPHSGNLKHKPTAIAIGAHPDDIEFFMAGTLLLLKRAGYEIHYFNIANGCCGSQRHGPRELSRIRLREARNAANQMGACFHAPLCRDLEIFYEPRLLRRVAAVIREVKPAIVLTHPPVDYMEDHTNTCRLVTTACFAHGMPNFRSDPPRPTADYDLTLYHSIPHSMHDPLRRRTVPDAFVNIGDVLKEKQVALAEHRSQEHWLGASQGAKSFLDKLEANARLVGSVSRKFKLAEGWTRHLHYGFSATETDPLRQALAKNYFSPKPEL